MKFDQSRFPQHLSPAYFDKTDKRRQIADYISNHEKRDGYIFLLDADDIVHPDIVSYIYSDNNGLGYVITDGFMWNVIDDEYGLLSPPDKDDPLPLIRREISVWSIRRYIRKKKPKGHIEAFYRHCGSCVATYFDFRKDTLDLDRVSSFNRHPDMPSIMRCWGFDLTPIPFAGAVYVLGHGENKRQARGKIHLKYSYIKNHKLLDAEADRVRDVFQIERLLKDVPEWRARRTRGAI